MCPTWSGAPPWASMAMMLLTLNPKASRALVLAILTHDLSERWCGDITYPAKVSNG